MSVLNRALREALSNAIQALELGEHAFVREPEIAVVLEEALVLDVAYSFGPLSELRRRILDSDESLRHALIDRVQSTLSSLDASFFRELCDQPNVDADESMVTRCFVDVPSSAQRALRLRIAQRALERVLGERVAPPLRFRIAHAMAPRDVAIELPGAFTHAVVVGELIGAVEELFPLVLDAYSVDLRCAGKVRLNVIGVHASWLDTEGRATRIIYYDHGARSLYEADVAEPLTLDSCQFLYLGSDEASLHQRLAAKLHLSLQLNAPEVSACCDDKFRTAQVLHRAGIRTPKALLLASHSDTEQLSARLDAAGFSGCSVVFVQPNRGTEGHGVVCVEIERPRSMRELERVVDGLVSRESSEALVRECVTGIRLTTSEGNLATSLRINVVWDGLRGHAESGYVQIAGKGQPHIASRGRGGTMAALSEGILEKLAVSQEELTLIRCVASSAVLAVNRDTNQGGQLGLFGVDVLFERTPNGPVAWVLEINSRPAGLSHSDFLDTHEPGVSTILFESLTNRLIGTCDRTQVREGAALP